MNQAEREERRMRVKRMHTILHDLFPVSRIHLNYKTNWELLVAVILSAQCTDARVNEVTKVLFKKYKIIEDYAKAPQREMEKLLFKTGFYKAKTKHVRGAASMILEYFGGRVPSTMSELMRIPGVGRKTALVVLTAAFEKIEGIAVDTHVRRFAIRFNLTDHHDPVHIEKDLMSVVERDNWWEFSHRLIEYGRMYCKAHKHDCRSHPLTMAYPQAEHIWPKTIRSK